MFNRLLQANDLADFLHSGVLLCEYVRVYKVCDVGTANIW